MVNKDGFKKGRRTNLPLTKIQSIIKTRNIEDGILKCKIFGCKGKPLIEDIATGEII